MRIIKKLLLIIVFLSALYYVNAVNCGDTLTTSTNLTSDLINCGTLSALKLDLGYGPTNNQNLILDCNNHTISSATPYSYTGVEVFNENYDNHRNITIKNCVIKDFEKGITFVTSGQLSDTIITYNSFINNKNGIYIQSSDYINVYIEKNSFFGNGLYEGFISGPGTGAINIRDYVNDINKINIKNNCIINNTGFAIYIDYPVASPSRVKINYNTIDNNFPPPFNYKFPGATSSEIGLCFSNALPNLCGNLNIEANRLDITNNFWNYSGAWQPSYLDPICSTGEVSIYIGGGVNPISRVSSGSSCCPIGANNDDICNTLPYLNSNPIPGWEICTDNIDNDCDTLIDNNDPDCPAYCGNNIIGGNEQCDGINLNNKDCTNYIPNSPYTGGILYCNPPGSPNQCQFNTQNCLTCGVEGSTSNCAIPGNINQQDGCCGPGVSPIYPAGLKCRYYEFESISYPYAKKCCENGLETTRQCGSVSGNNVCTSSSNDVACCDEYPHNTEDCVYNNKCYTDDLDPSRADITIEGMELQCTLKHWCPLGFVWSNVEQECVYQGATCHIDTGINTNWCYSYTSTYPTLNYPYIEDPENCLLDLQSPPLTLPYEKSCCYDFSLFSTNYYSWTGISVYDTNGNLVSSGGGAT